MDRPLVRIQLGACRLAPRREQLLTSWVACTESADRESALPFDPAPRYPPAARRRGALEPARRSGVRCREADRALRRASARAAGLVAGLPAEPPSADVRAARSAGGVPGDAVGTAGLSGGGDRAA